MAEDYSLGTARGYIELDASSLSRAAAAFDLLGNKMLLIGGLAIAGFGYAVKSAADFEQQMSRFGAVGSATESQMDKIREKALQLGRDSAYGAGEVVKAFTELAYAGASTREIIDGLGDATVYLAAAGEIPLADAATTLINTLRQFNLPASKAVEVANEIARAANASTINIDDLNTSLRYVGSTAAQMGLPFRDVAQAIAVLGNEGIRGSTAGTSLRGVLVGLLATSGPAKEAMHELGLDTNSVGNNFFTAEGKLRSFKEIAEILKGSLGGLKDQVFNLDGTMKSSKEINDLLANSNLNLTDKVKLNAFAHLFQRRAMGAAFALAKDGSDAFDKLSRSAQYNTTAQEIMQKKLDNLKGSLKILGASLETLGIVIGSNFTPYLKAASDVLRELVNWFIKMPKPMQQIIGFALLFGGSFLVVGGALAKISALSIKSYKAFVDLGKGLQIMGGLMSSAIESMQALWAVMLANPIFLIILALVAIGVAFYLLYTRSETFRRGIQRIWGAIKEGAEWLYNWVKQNWPDLIALLFGPIGVAYIIWRHFGDKIKEVAADIWQKVSGFFSNLYDAVTGWTAQAYHDVVDWFARLPGVIGGFLAHLIDIVVQFVEKIPYYFGYALGVAIALIVISYKKILDLFTNLFLDLIQLQISFVKWFIDKTIEWGSKTIVAIINFMAQLPGLIWGFLLQVIAFFVNFVAMMVQKTVELGFSVLSTIFQFFSQLPGIILNFLQQALNFVIFIAGQVIQSIINMGYSVISEAWNFFSQLPGTILNAIGDAYHLLYDWGANVIHGLIDGIKSLIGDVTGVIGSIGGGIKDGFSKAVHLGSPSKDFRQYGQWIVQGLILGMQDMGSALGTATQAIGTTIKAAAGISSDLYPAKGTGPGYSKGYYDYIPGQPPSGSTTNIEINNPVGETAEDSLSKTMQRLAYVGVTE